MAPDECSLIKTCSGLLSERDPLQAQRRARDVSEECKDNISVKTVDLSYLGS